MRRPLSSRRAPLWFYVLVAAIVAVALRELVPAPSASGGAGPTSHPPALAFFAILGAIVDAIWKGIEVAGRVALAILQYSVHWAWRAIALLGKGAAELAGYAWKGLRKTWTALKFAVLHPKRAWEKLWHWVDNAEQWLKDTFGPTLDWLQRQAQKLRTFWHDYVQPWLDVIDVTRRGLRVLGSLGFEWAKRLDAALGAIEDRITSKYLELVGYVNDLINIVNRVVTADGLFQKLAYVRTYARDVKDIVNQTGWGLHRPITGDERAALKKLLDQRSLSVIARDMGQYMRDGTGPDAEWLNQTAAAVRVWLGGLP
jgi:hypothetical protein